MTMRPVIEDAERIASPALARLTTREQERLLALARRHFRAARRHAVLSDYFLGLKVEVIALRHGVSPRMVSRIAADEGAKHPLLPLRPQGRPKGASKSPASLPAVGKPHDEPFGSAGREDLQLEQAA